MTKLASALLVVGIIGSIPACSCDNSGTGGGDAFDDASIGDGGIGDANPDSFIGVPNGDGFVIIHTDGGDVICYITPCQGHLYQCGDCMDNDGDGLVDSMDPDCLGACQNNEAGFTGNIPGQNNAPCKADCYWDQDTGSGNDDCYWDHSCDPFENMTPVMTNPEIGCAYDPNTHFPGGGTCAQKLAMQSTQCDNFCKPLTPNGCDCFGCCENPLNAGHYVYAGSQNAAGQGTCNATPAALNDPTQCKPCTPVTGCLNGCGHCQLCFGKTTLPADCFPPADGGPPPNLDGGVVGQCTGGAQPCGVPGEAPCAPGYYCVTGCCQSLIF